MMMKYSLLFGGFMLVLLVWAGCRKDSDTGVRVESDTFEKLSDYRFFTGELKNLTPNEGVLPYDLKTPLFSDYAEKARFVWMPKGVSAVYNISDVLDFPVGAVLIKNFFYPIDQRNPAQGRRIIETRLLIHQPGGWDASTYVWNDEQTEARIYLAGTIRKVEYTDAAGTPVRVNYVVPTRNQCKGCHAYDDKLIPIGPKVRNLDKSYAYIDGEEDQLVRWAKTGYLSGVNGHFMPFLAQWDDPASGSIQDRAMAYLDVNCGHCHNPHGAANTSGLFLTADEKPGPNLGIFKAPVSTGKGSGGRLYSIVPGHPEASILLYRMESTDPGAMMPEVGRTMVHAEGVELIREWIASLGS